MSDRTPRERTDRPPSDDRPGGASGDRPSSDRCRATRRDGAPCAAGRRPGSLYCLGHDPKMRRRVEAGRVRGGKNSAASARLARHMPEHLRTVGERLQQAIEQVHAGTLDPRRLQAMAAGARALLELTAHGGTAVRLEALEAKIDRALRDAS